VHAHFGEQGWESLRLAKALGAPLITSFYGGDAWQTPVARPEWCGRFRELFERGDLFLVEGSAFRQRLVDLGCPRDKIRIQRLGVDTARLVYRQRNFASPLKIAIVGRFTEKKGLVDGLHACARAAASGIDLTVTVIGDDENDVVGQEIKRQLLSIASLPVLSGRVVLLGYLAPDELKYNLERHDVLLCPSKHASDGDAEGGLPVVLLEAMAMGLLCVGSRHCDIPEAIYHGKTGYLFEEGNINELSALLCSLPTYRDYCSALTQAARRHVEAEFELAKQLSSLSCLYHCFKGNPRPTFRRP
jgi:colanic acid/amylovoran biosynthesis glycosyltransferase